MAKAKTKTPKTKQAITTISRLPEPKFKDRPEFTPLIIICPVSGKVVTYTGWGRRPTYHPDVIAQRRRDYMNARYKANADKLNKAKKKLRDQLRGRA
jgi:hypothetical protein